MVFMPGKALRKPQVPSGRVISYEGSHLVCKIVSQSNEEQKSIPKENVICIMFGSPGPTLFYVEIFEQDHYSRRRSSGNGEADDDFSHVAARTYLREVELGFVEAGLLQMFSMRGGLKWLTGDDETVTEPDGSITAPNRNPQPQVVILVSTGSGTRGAEAAYHNLVQPLIARLLDIATYARAIKPGAPRPEPEVIFTASATTITSYAQTAISARAANGIRQTIILLTGDSGTVELVNGLLHPDIQPASSTTSYVKPTLVAMPLGTGNALFHSTRTIKDATLGLAALLRGEAHDLPLMRIQLPAGTVAVDSQGQPEHDRRDAPGMTVNGAVVFSWCFHASLVADSDGEAFRKFGAQRFQMAAKENLFPEDGSGPHVYRGAVQVRREGGGSWRTLERDGFSYLLLTPVSNLEETFCISPESRPLDGVLRLVHMPELKDGGQGVMRVMQEAYQGGKHIEESREVVGYEVVEGLRLKMEEEEERWRRVCVDGKIYLVRGSGWVEVDRESREVVQLMVL